MCILVPTKFGLKERESKYGHSKFVYSPVQRVYVSETNLEDIPSVDAFDYSRLYMLDNCANANIWNAKEDFEVDYLRFNEMPKLCDDEVQSMWFLKFTNMP